MPLENPPPVPPHEWVVALAIAIGYAAAGRLMWHVGQVQDRKRRFWSWALLGEGAIAIGMGVIGGGLAEYLALEGKASAALIAAVAYLGPRGTEAALRTLYLRRGGNGGGAGK